MIDNPTIFAKAFSDTTSLEEAKREVAATMLYEMVERTLLHTMR
jgi:hypothetical protein